VALRVISTFLVMYDRRYTWRERLFYAFAWTPKATVQASLSAVPLSLIMTTMAGRPDYDMWRMWGEEILTTGVFAIIICECRGGPRQSRAVQRLGLACLGCMLRASALSAFLQR
jgi:hypothetical protein